MRTIFFVIFTLSIGLRFTGDTFSFLSPFFMAVFSAVAFFALGKFRLRAPFKNDKILVYSLVFFVFIFYTYISLIWTNSINYGFWKITFLSSWIIMFLVFYEFIREYFDLFILWTFITLIIILIAFYFRFGSIIDIYSNISQFYRLGSENINPISYARFFGYGIIVFLFLNTKIIKINRLLLLLVPVISFSYMILSGSKGPVISFLVAMVYYLTKMKKRKLYFLSLTAFSSIFIIFLLNQANQNLYFNSFIQERFLIDDLYESGSFNTRFQRLDVGLDAIKSNLDSGGKTEFIFGSGSGNYSYIYMGQDATSYPHNIFIEITYEYGVIGLVLFLYLIIIVPVVSFIRSRFTNNSIILFFQTTWIYFFVNSMVSGDLSQNFMLFGTSFILAILTLENQNDLLYRTNITTR